MGDVIGIIHIPESELEHFHAGKSELVTEMFHFCSDDSQIFSKDGKILTQLFFDGKEKVFTGALDPGTVYCSLLTGGNGPVRFKSTEMVDAQVIRQRQLPLNTADPPGVRSLLMVIPVIKGISPELSRLAEIIWRDFPQHWWGNLWNPAGTASSRSIHQHCQGPQRWEYPR